MGIWASECWEVNNCTNYTKSIPPIFITYMKGLVSSTYTICSVQKISNNIEHRYI